MYNVFNQVPSIVGTEFSYQGMPYVRDQIRRNVDRAKQYYRDNYFRVPSNHVLCKIIQSITVDMDLPLDEYMSVVDNQADRMYTLHEITSTTMTSRPTRNQFYGNNSVEILIADHRDVDLTVDWRDLVPVTVVSHFRSDLVPVRPGMPFNSNEEGLSVLQINVVALMVQYRGWYHSLESEGKTPAQFVGQYPLVNLLESTTDVAVFNRHYNHLLGRKNGVPSTGVPFMTLNNERHLDRICEIVGRKIMTTIMSPDAILMNIPVIYAESAYHLQTLDQYIHTNQIIPSMVAAKIPYVGLVMDYLNRVPYGDARGTKIRLRLRHDIARLAGNKLIDQGLPSNIAARVWQTIDEQIRPNL